MRPRWRKVGRDLTSHMVRTVLVVLSIAVGIFAVSVVLGSREVLIREFDVDFELSVPPSAEFDTTGFAADLPRRVAEREDVRAAEARRRVNVRYSKDGTVDDKSTAGWESMTLWAIPDYPRSGVKKLVREETTSWPPGLGEVVLERSALQIEMFSVGDTFAVETEDNKIVELRMVGFAHDINAIPAQFQGALTGFVSMETLELLGEPEDLNHLSIVLDPTISRAAASRIAADVRDTDLSAAGVRTHRLSVPDPGSHFLGDIFKAISLLLLALGVMSLALSAFLVVTTVQAIMAQQVRQVGIMKAIGGRRTQISRMYLALVAVYGVVAIGIGIPVGHFVGKEFIEYAAGVLNFRVTSYTPPAWVLALEAVVGILVPIAAAAVPVHRGSTLRVVEALNAANVVPRFGHGVIDRALGLVRGLPRPVALSLRNTFLRKGRLALTLTTLVLASGVVMAVLSVRASMLQTVDDIGTAWNYDAQVFMARPLPRAELERHATKVEGVTATESWLEVQGSLKRPDGSENQEIFMLGVPSDTRFVRPMIEAGRWLEPGARNEMVIDTDVLNKEPYLRVGDTVSLSARGVEEDWTIVGVARGQLMGSTAFVDREELDIAVGAGGGVTRLLVQAEDRSPDAQARTARALERRLDDASLPISGSQTHTAQTENIGNKLGILVTFLVIMAAILASVGVIGLTGTMTINVLESTREIGVMRSIGASHGSIFGIYITEGVVVAFMAWAVGAVLSWPFSVWLVSSLGTAMALPLSYRFWFPGVAAWLVLVLVISAIASLLPAWRASQVSIRDAISYE